jgi:WD40 repeat protein
MRHGGNKARAWLALAALVLVLLAGAWSVVGYRLHRARQPKEIPFDSKFPGGFDDLTWTSVSAGPDGLVGVWGSYRGAPSGSKGADQVHLYSAETGESRGSLGASLERLEIAQATFSPAGGWAATIEWTTRKLRLWRLEDRTVVASLPLVTDPETECDLCFSPEGDALWVEDARELEVLSVPDLKVLRRFPNVDRAWAPLRGGRFATDNGTCLRIRGLDGALVGETAHGSCTSATFSPRGDLEALVVDNKADVEVRSVPQGALIQRVVPNAEDFSPNGEFIDGPVKLSDDGELLACSERLEWAGGTNHAVVVYAVKDGRHVGTFGVAKERAYKYAFAQDRDVLIAASMGKLYLWPFQRGSSSAQR